MHAPADPDKPIRQQYNREPVGSFLNGAEHVRIINGNLTVIVKLQDGGEEPLSELVVTQIIERRKVERYPHLFVATQAPHATSDSISGEPRGTDTLSEALQKLKERMKLYTIELSWNDRDGIDHRSTLEMPATDYPDVLFQFSSKVGEFSASFGVAGVQIKIVEQNR